MRTLRRLARSTPFRLALSFAIFLLAAFLLSGLVVYRIAAAELAERVDEALASNFSVVASAYQEGDADALVRAVRSRAEIHPESDQIFSLSRKDGEAVAGLPLANVASLPQRAYRTFPASVIGVRGDEQYRVFVAPVGDYLLVVAISETEMAEVQLVILYGFIWATIVAAALAVLGGALIAARIQRRLDAIASTMEGVSQGRLDARIPLLGNNDDIDAVSAQINAALERIASLMDGLRQVGVDIAHDLRTPLNRLRIILEEARARAGSGDVLADLDDANREVDHTIRTFDALLRIAQIEAGARRARFRPLDMAEILTAIAEAYREVAVDDGKSLTVDAGEAASVSGDRELLLQMFANLVENALHHTPTGTRIELGCRPAGPGLHVWARDDGPGIPPEERDKVFRRLYRMDKSRNTPGNGLGLSMVRAILELHAATVSLEDAHPGLLVRMEFPRV